MINIIIELIITDYLIKYFSYYIIILNSLTAIVFYIFSKIHLYFTFVKILIKDHIFILFFY